MFASRQNEVAQSEVATQIEVSPGLQCLEPACGDSRRNRRELLTAILRKVKAMK